MESRFAFPDFPKWVLTPRIIIKII
jgi:hypothetical protein